MQQDVVRRVTRGRAPAVTRVWMFFTANVGLLGSSAPTEGTHQEAGLLTIFRRGTVRRDGGQGGGGGVGG